MPDASDHGSRRSVGSGFANSKATQPAANPTDDPSTAASQVPRPADLTAFDIWSVEVPNLLGWACVGVESASNRPIVEKKAGVNTCVPASV